MRRAVRWVLWASLVLAASCDGEQGSSSVAPSPEEEPAGGRGGKADVYGEDTRLEAYEALADPALAPWVEASALLADLGQLRQEGEALRLETEDLRETLGLCTAERFAAQPSLAGACSGFLVAPDLVMTAGHCVQGGSAVCDRRAVVFGYGYDTPEADPTLRPLEEVSFCQEVLWYEDTDVCERDVALLRIDPPILHRAPLPLRPSGVADDGAPLAVVGHPLGWPLKIDVGAAAVGEGGVDHLVTFADSNAGNSGGAVIHREHGWVEGVHICGGEEAGLARTEAGCKAQRRCEAVVPGAEVCGGSRAMRVASIAELVGPGWQTWRSPDAAPVEVEPPAGAAAPRVGTLGFTLTDPAARAAARLTLITPDGARRVVWDGAVDRPSLSDGEQHVRLEGLEGLADSAGAWSLEAEGASLESFRLHLRW